MADKDGSPGPEPPLDTREAEILRSVIREHLATGEPVGSRRVSTGSRLDLSPASIRNIMGTLEERGMLTQPHASAGRVPTDLAYRFYVDHLMGTPRVEAAQARAIDEALGRSRGEVPDLLEEASRQLSRHSRQVGLVLAPELQRVVVERIEFVRIDPSRVVAVLVGRSGVVHNRILDVAEPPLQPELDRIGRYLTEDLGGRTLPEMREELRRSAAEQRDAWDRLRAQGLALVERVGEGDEPGGGVFVEGASRLLENPEFSDREVARGLFRALEEKRSLIALLERVLDGPGVRILIGGENPDTALSGCSVVASPYRVEGRPIGTVGIVGPTRMAYARAVALVDHLARALSRLLDPAGDN